MQTERTTGPTNPARSPHARLLAVLRGDKYMVNAYPPGWRNPAGTTEAHRPDGTQRSAE
jgi:hypothetical protein